MKHLIPLIISLFFSCTQQPKKKLPVNTNHTNIKVKETHTPISNTKLDSNFTYLHQAIPNLVIDLKYFSSNNFIGKPIAGYKSNRAILSKQATTKLSKVQQELNSKGLGLKIFDAYRPQKAVNHFIDWAKDLSDTLKKQDYYPNSKKQDLFQAGYISSHSGHSRGSTVDLTIINLATKEELDMGSKFDMFDSISNTFNKNITPQQLANRKLLRNTMKKHGFYSYLQEWWHFTSWNEPFKNKYWNFDIE